MHPIFKKDGHVNLTDLFTLQQQQNGGRLKFIADQCGFDFHVLLKWF